MDLNKEQKEALDLALQGENLFITGAAGVGKSFLIKNIVDALTNGDIYYELLAFTGIAAINIQGNTIHRMFALKPETKTLKDYIDHNVKQSKINWEKIKLKGRCVFIIDEISMLHGTIFTLIHQICQYHLMEYNVSIQFILIGDFFQLGPIKDKTDPYGTKLYPFETESWNILNPHSVILSQVMRQKDDNNFVDILNEIRVGKLSEDGTSLLEETSKNVKDPEKFYIKLFCKNIDKDLFNEKALEVIDEPPIVFKSEDSGRETLLKNIRSPEILTLKIGAVVMLTVNKPEHKLCNGSVGVIEDFAGETYRVQTGPSKDQFENFSEMVPVVRFNNGVKLSITRNIWQVRERNKNGTFITVASRMQIPLVLSWAISIHKSQGLSLDYVECDFAGVFCGGLVYVALSRCTSKNGLITKNFEKRFVKKNKIVDEFYATLK